VLSTFVQKAGLHILQVFLLEAKSQNDTVLIKEVRADIVHFQRTLSVACADHFPVFQWFTCRGRPTLFCVASPCQILQNLARLPVRSRNAVVNAKLDVIMDSLKTHEVHARRLVSHHSEA
jgi:hypothetical protein